MKTLKLTQSLLGIILVSSLTLTSCHKTKLAKGDEDSDTTEASDQSSAENISNDIINIGSQATDNNGSLSSYRTSSEEESLSLCATVKRDTINHIDSVIFNNSGCMDGRVRNGILIFNYAGSTNGAKHYRDPGFKCSVTSVGYSVDDKKINIISKTIENITPVGFNPASTNLSWKITGHIQITKENGTHDMSFNRIKTLLNTNDVTVYHGSSAPISWNRARIGITGTASGTTAKGKDYTCQIISQLIRDFGGCTIGNRHPFIQGTLQFTPGEKATRLVDFGQGTCDLDATVTINGKTHNITLN